MIKSKIGKIASKTEQIADIFVDKSKIPITPINQDSEFATAVLCIDGRIQKDVYDFIKTNINVRYVDMITEPAPEKIISSIRFLPTKVIIDKINLSIAKHKSKGIFLFGHNDCAANDDAKEDEQLAQLRKAHKVLRGFINPQIPIKTFMIEVYTGKVSLVVE